MVAIVSGNSLGLLNGSAGVLGQQGVFGNAVHGNGKEAAYVNVFNGNLSLQDQDDFLASRGVNVALTRTYNSRAQFTDGLGNWKNGLSKKVTLVGAINDVNSVLKRIDSDGSESEFKYSKLNTYVSTDGAGGYQTITYNASNPASWTWEGDRTDIATNGTFETYNAATGLIANSGDQFGIRLTYLYNPAGRLIQLTDATGATGVAGAATGNTVNDQINFTYDSYGNLTQMNSTLAANGGTFTRTRYSYYISADNILNPDNRLKSVTVDLTPADGVIADGKQYTTDYEYDGASDRISKVIQPDGTVLEFSYVQDADSKWRIASFKDALERTTTFDYVAKTDSADAYTTVTDPLQNKISYSYDSKGQLTAVSAPNSAVDNQKFTYDTDGNLLSSVDSRGVRTEYEYVRGNRTKQRDSLGNVVIRTYSTGGNKLLTETVYLALDKDQIPVQPQTTRYAYDTNNRLRFVVSAQGRVTEYVYPDTGGAAGAKASPQMSSERHYSDFYVLGALATTPDVPLPLATLTTWLTGKANTVTDYAYDNRGLLKTLTEGKGSTDETVTNFIYDQAGQLLSSTDNNSAVTTYTYDGLGHLLSKVVKDGATTLYQTGSGYDNAGASKVVTAADGSVTTYNYDKAGQLISVQQPAAVGSGVTSYIYDNTGRLRCTTDANGQSTFWLYDALGRKTAQIEADGAVTEYQYNAANQLTRAISHANKLKLDAATKEKLGSTGNPLEVSLSTLELVADVLDRSSWNIYDLAGRLSDAVDASGFVTHIEYDGAGRQTIVTRRALPVALSALQNAGTLTSLTQQASDDDHITRSIYDLDGKLAGKIDALGYLTENVYNGAGLLVETISYGKAIPLASRKTDGLAALRSAATIPASDLHQYFVYDAKNQLVGTVDGDKYLTEIVYDKLGNVLRRTRYANTVSTPVKTTLATLITSLGTTLAFVNNRSILYSYNKLNQLITEQGAEQASAGAAFTLSGNLTTYAYDLNGNRIKETRSLGTVIGNNKQLRYDALGRLVGETAGPGAKETVYTYDSAGLRTSMTDPNGNKTLYFYDDVGRLTHTVNALGELTAQAYNAFGQIVSTRQYANRIAAAALSALTGGSNAAMTQAAASIQDHRNFFFYDQAGRLSYTVNGAGEIEKRGYDNFNTVVESIHYSNAITSIPSEGLTASIVNAAIATSDAGKNQRSVFSYDASGRLSYTVNPMGEKQSSSFDFAGRRLSTTQESVRSGETAAGKAANSTQLYGYDNRGNQISYVDAQGNKSSNTVNAFGEVLVGVQRFTANDVTGHAQDIVVRNYYDEDGQLQASIDGSGALTVFQYDVNGNVIERLTYAKVLTPAQVTAASLATATAATVKVQGATLVDVAHDARQRFMYDARNRLTATFTAKQLTNEWSVTTLAYDDNGNVIQRIAYATAVVSPLTFPLTAMPVLISAATDVATQMFYDKAGRLTDTVTAHGLLNAKRDWSLVSQQYDAFGNISAKVIYSARVSATAVTTANVDTLKSGSDAATKATTRYYYDGLNRVVRTATAQGAVTVAGDVQKMQWAIESLQYDAAGNIGKRTQYATMVLLNLNEEPSATPAGVPLRDRSTSYAYDAANRLIRTTDAEGGITELRYDAKGNVIARTEKDGSGASRTTRITYDLNKRPVFEIDAAGYVSENRYDALGNVAMRIRYDKALTTAALSTIDETSASVTAVLKPNVALDRSESYIYDDSRRLLFSIDSAGYLSENQYSALGKLLKTLQYSKSQDYGDKSVATITGKLASAGPIRTTTFDYDAYGNLLKNTDVLEKSETYTYDALGRKLQTTDRLSSATKYTYDATGNVIEQTTGTQKIRYSYNDRGWRTSMTDALGNRTLYFYDSVGRMTSTVDAVGAVLHQEFDTLGQVISSTRYSKLIDAATLASLEGGPDSALVLPAADGADQHSVFYYDKTGRLTYTVNAAGEVDGRSYTAFDQLSVSVRYSVRLSQAVLSALQGGYIEPQLSTLIAQANLPANVAQNRISTFQYDANGRLTFSINANGEKQESTYNAFGQLTDSTRYGVRTDNISAGKSANSVERYTYNLRGQVVDYTDPAGNHIATNYNGFGDVIERAQRATPGSVAIDISKDSITRKFYDAKGQLKASIDPAAALTVYQYDSKGNLTDRRTYAKVLTAANLTTAKDLQVALTTIEAMGVVDAANDDHQVYVYDARGRLITTSTAKESALWAVEALTYNENDQVIERIAYATPMALPATPVLSSSDAVSHLFYDKDGRLCETLTAQRSVLNASKVLTAREWSLTSIEYDSFGNVAARTAYSVTGSGLIATMDVVAAIKNDGNALPAVTRYGYDSMNRAISTAVAQAKVNGTLQWAFTSQSYDAAGNLSSRTQYATAATQAADSTIAQPAADAARDRTTTYKYDLANRLSSTADAEQGVVELRYDARGNITQRIAGTGTGQRITRTVYDLNDRPVYDIDALGAVTERNYDTLGNVIKSIRYANPINAGAVTETTNSVSGQLILASGKDRTQYYVYDQDRQLRFTIDAGGYLTENRYDAVGHLTETRAYPALLTYTDYGLVAMVAKALSAGAPRITLLDYDAMGNLLKSTDAMGKSESYTYDALGNKTSFSNKMDSIWEYQYDATGRLLLETSPEVDAYVNAPENYTHADWATRAHALVKLQTAMQYDALGNLKSRTEGFGSAQPRVTLYGYDLVGRQTLTTLAPVKVYAAPVSPQGVADRTETEVTPTIVVSYDMLGNAVSNKDVGGKLSYKIYDKQGQVRFEIDAKGNVTGYERDSFGAVVTLTRYAQPQTAATTLSASAFKAALKLDSADRVITTIYDQLGHVRKVIEPQTQVYDQHRSSGDLSFVAGRTTESRYNGFGELIQQAVYGGDSLGNAIAGVESTDNRYYYDTRGNKVGLLQAVANSDTDHRAYLTTYGYDDVGNLTSQYEYSRALSAWSDNLSTPSADVDIDRSTAYKYDGANRRTEETRLKVGFSESATPTVGTTGSLTTTYGYDALGNQISATDPLGGATYTYYDKLGRVTAIAKVQTTTVTGITAGKNPLTEFKLDIYGNVQMRIEYAKGITVAIGAAQPAATVIDAFFANTANRDATNDRITSTRYDVNGHALQVYDAETKVSYASYDVYGRLAKQWRPVTNANGVTETAFQINRYDALGQLYQIEKPGNVDLVYNTVVGNTVQQNNYNAFGEMTDSWVSSGANDAKLLDYRRYDNAGHVWLTNSGDNVDKAFIYDVRGQVTSQIRVTDNDEHRLRDAGVIAGALSFNANQTLRTNTRYDLLGRAVDSTTVDGRPLTLMRRVDGNWVKGDLTSRVAEADSLIVVGAPSDQVRTYTLSYRLNGGAWTPPSGMRISTVDGYTVFNPAGLEAGSYEYRVFVQPAGEAVFEADGGVLTLSSTSALSKNEQIARLYLMLLNRNPDLGGMNGWIARLNSGSPLGQVAYEIMTSAEAALQGKSGTDIVKTVFLQAFGWQPSNDPAYLADVTKWAARLNAKLITDPARGQVLLDMLSANNKEKEQLMAGKVAIAVAAVAKEAVLASALELHNGAGPASDSTPLEEARLAISRLYVAILRRAPDHDGMVGWINRRMDNASLDQIANDMVNSKETEALAALSDVEFIKQMYWNILDREADSAGLAYWLSKFQGATRGAIVVGIMNGLLSYNGDDAIERKSQALFNNKASVSMIYALNMSGKDLLTEQKILGKVTATDITAALTYAADAIRAMVKEAAKSIEQDTKTAAELTLAAVTAAQGLVNANTVATTAASQAAANPMAAPMITVARLYVGLLKRSDAPGQTLDIGGITFWTRQLMNATTPAAIEATETAIAQSMIDSAEGKQLYGYTVWNADAAKAFITKLYQQIIGREPDPDGLIYWADKVTTPAQRGLIGAAMVHSVLDNQLSNLNPGKAAEQGRVSAFNNKVGIALGALSTDATRAVNEASAALAAANLAVTKASAATSAATVVTNTTNASAARRAKAAVELIRMYVGILNRGPGRGVPMDLGGLNYWIDARVNSGSSLENIATNMLTSAEGLALFPASMSAHDFVNKIYQQAFNRTLASGDTFWEDKITSGVAKNVIAVGILGGLFDNVTPSIAEMSNKADREQFLASALGQIAGLTALAASTTVTTVNTALNTRDNAVYNAALALQARDRAQAATAAADPAVIAALKAKNEAQTLLGSSLRRSLTELMVAFRQPVDYANVQRTLADLTAGRTTLTALAGQYAGPITDRSAFFSRLYTTVLNREADAGGLAYWVGNASSDPAALAYGFFTAGRDAELYNVNSYRGTFGAELNTAFDANTASGNSIVAAYNSTVTSVQQAIDAAKIQTQKDLVSADAAAKAATDDYNLKSVALAVVIEGYRATAATAVVDSLMANDSATAAATIVKTNGDTLTVDITVAGQTSALAMANSMRSAASLDAALSKARAGVDQAGIAVTLNAQALLNAPATTRQITLITQFYVALIGRLPTMVELSVGFNSFQTGGDATKLAQKLISDNPVLFTSAMSNADFVGKLYQNTLGRAADDGPANYWTKILNANPAMPRAQLAVEFIDSIVQRGITQDTVGFNNKITSGLNSMSQLIASAILAPNVGDYVKAQAIIMRDDAALADAAALAAMSPAARYTLQATQLYTLLFRRIPDAGGLRFWVSRLTAGASMAQMAKDMLSGTEGLQKFPPEQSNAAFIANLITNGLGRQASPEELTRYNALLDGGQTRDQLAVTLINDVLAYADGDTAQLASRTLYMGHVATALDVLDYVAGKLLVGEVKIAPEVLDERTSDLYKQLLSGPAPALATLDTSQLAILRYNGMQIGINNGSNGEQRGHLSNTTTFDRWGNVLSMADARDPNWVVTYTYNANNQVLKQTMNGVPGTVGYAANNTYDRLGRNLSVTDAKNQTNSTAYDSNGFIITETHADGAVVTYVNDVFGQHTKMTVALTNDVTTSFAAGAASSVITSYAYDRLGHQISKTSAPVAIYYAQNLVGTNAPPDMNVLAATAAVSGQAIVIIDTYQYDELGRRIRSTNDNTSNTATINKGYALDPNKRTSSSVRYDLSGNVISTTDALGFSTLSSFDIYNHRTAQQDANGGILRWDNDSAGRVLVHYDLSGRQTKYGYDTAGQMLSQTRKDGTTVTQTLQYSYDGSGQLLQIADSQLPSGPGATGPLALVQTTSYTYDLSGNRLTERVWLEKEQRAVLDNSMIYDRQGRVQEIASNVKAAYANQLVIYSYDNNGNRTKVTTTFTTDTGATKTIEINNRFDKMNRQNHVDGSVTTSIAAAGDGKIDTHDIKYDGAGNRSSDTYGPGKDAASTYATETYNYDAVGRLSFVTKAGNTIVQRYYDGAGRIIRSRDNNDIRVNAYDADGRMTRQRSATYNGTFEGKYVNDIHYAASVENAGGGYDRVGNLLVYRVVEGASDYNAQTFRNDYSGRQFDSYQITSTTATPAASARNASAVTVTRLYDYSGALVEVQSTDEKKNRTLINDSSGRVLENKQGGIVTHTLIANDQVIGSADQKHETYSSGFESISSPALMAGQSVYIVQDKDTLESIAKAVWGDGRLWYLIAEANGGIDNTGLVLGQPLTMPARVNTVLNSYQTFKPYNAAEAIGDITPVLPAPAAGGCGGVGMIIMIVVAVVVTVISGGAMAGFAAQGLAQAMLVGAAASMAGSIASQVVGMAIGAQDGFSWKAVGQAGISGAIGGGMGFESSSQGTLLGDVFKGSDWSATAARAALGNTITQGVGIVTHQQSGFNWRSVAASAASAAVGSQFGNPQGTKIDSWGTFGTAMAGNFASGVTSAVVRGGRVEIGRIAADAFGNALGNSLAAQLSEPSDTTLRSKGNLDKRISQTNTGLAALDAAAQKYGGYAQIPLDSEEYQLALTVGKTNNSTMRAIAGDSATANGFSNGNSQAPKTDDPALPGVSRKTAEMLRVEVSGSLAEAQLYQVDRGVAVSGGVVAGMFQSIGDGIIGSATLIKDGLLAQRYVMGGGDNERARSSPLFDAEKEAFQNFKEIGNSIAKLVQHPQDTVSQALGGSYEKIQSRLDTAYSSTNLGDWFLYGASVGNATMNIASALAGGVGAVRGIASGASALKAGLQSRLAALAPDVRVSPFASELSTGKIGANSVGANGLSNQLGLHPDAWASMAGEVNMPSVMRALRQSGTTEGAAVAKLLKRGDLKVNFSDEILLNPQGGLMPYASNEMTIFKNYSGTPSQTAGLVAHEGEHFLQSLTPRQYANGPIALEKELAAYSVQRRVDSSFFLRTDREAIEYMVKSPLYPQIDQSAANAFLQSGAKYSKRLK
ncbi:DUF4214 domain-containing protein [Oxalobacteraceae bacterium]|nr:DUF4214 domain-containing protein [Oxalobacteraceae bacterium]